MTAPTTEISIVICSKDRRDSLKRLLGQLSVLVFTRSFEIVVVEETGSPAPVDGVTYLSHPPVGRGIPYARNLGLKQAKGEIIVFVDDDCLICEGWMERLLTPFEDKTVVGVQGGVTVDEAAGFIGWAESILGFPGGGVRRILMAGGKRQVTREISTLNCAYRKWVLDEIGGFDERLKVGGEDYVLAKQACRFGECVFVPEAVVTHAPRGALKSIFRWFVRRGRADIDVIRIGRQTDRTFFNLMKDSITVKAFMVAVICACIPRLAPAVIMLSVLGFFLLQYRRYYRPWQMSDAPAAAFVVLPIVKLVMDLGMDWGRFRRMFLEPKPSKRKI